MSDITILHLSDIHFKKNKDGDSGSYREDVQRKMVETIKTHASKHGTPHFVAVTGDIAFSGKEYDQASVFFKELNEVFNGHSEFLLVPGNHDINRDEIRALSLHSIINNKDKIDRLLDSPKEVDTYIQGKYKAYREFVDQIHPQLYNDDDRYFWVKDFADRDVGFLGLNSCWACENDADRNNITLGYPQIVKAMKRSTASNRIALMHHPFNWLNEEDFNRYSGEIFKNCKLILHGHTHYDNALVFKNPSHSCICLGANASYTKDKDGFIGFQFIETKFSGRELTVKVWPYRLEERNRLRFVPDIHRWEEQDGPFFELSTFTAPAKELKETKENIIPLSIPEAYKKWLEEFHSLLPMDQLAKKGEVILIQLPEVYIALETANPFYKPMTDEHKKEKNEVAELEKVPPTIEIEELLGQWNCLLLRGNAGMGKTTLIKHLAYSLTHGTGPGSLNGYLPVIVLLKDLWPLYKSVLLDGAGDMTFEALLTGYLKKVQCPLTMETIDAYLKQGQTLFLIDGLDEVPDENRAALVNMIHRFQFQHSQNRFLITGRPHGIEGSAVNCFSKYLRDIEPLAGQKVEEFINRWFRAVSGQAKGYANVNAADMISEINLHEHAAVFTGNPLLLTALCVFYLVGGKRIPDQRADLYDRIVANLLYRRFYDPADTGKEIKVREYLMDLAFTMHSDNIKSIEPYKAREILRQKEHYPIMAGESTYDYKKRIDELFNSIEPVCGLLNRLSSGEIEFAHLTFQEFLAAKQMQDRDMDYKLYLEESWWKESLLLYLGLINLDRKTRSNEIACEIIKNNSQPCIQLIGAKALQDFQATRREEYAISQAREKLLAIIESRAALEERFEAGEILGYLGDPRIPHGDALNPPMVRVPAGEFTRGSKKSEDEKPVRQIYLDEFMIGKYPVTNQEFRAFINDKGYEAEDFWTPEGWQWRQKNNICEPRLWHERKWNGPNFPVVGVCWYEAVAYANWLSRKTGKDYRLPTEAQWEKAARGSRGFQYPWGKEFDKDKCNSAESGLGRTSPVGIFPSGKSPYECLDMAGNVWEWCSDWYADNYYKESPDKNPRGPADGSGRALRGGSWLLRSDYLRCAARLVVNPRYGWHPYGFRVVLLFVPGHTQKGILMQNAE